MSVHLSIGPTAPGTPVDEVFDPQRFAEYLDTLQMPVGVSAIRDLLSGIHALNGTRVRIVLRQDLSEDIHRKLLRILPQLEAELVDLNVPLSPEKRAIFNLADDLLAALATSYKILLTEQSRRLFGLAASGRALVPVQRIMSLASRRMALAYRCHASVPKGAWVELHELHHFAVRRRLATRVPNDSTISPTAVYKRALLLAFSGPQRFTSDDLRAVMELIDRNEYRAEILSHRNECEEGLAYLVKPYRDHPGDAYTSARQQSIQAKDFLFSVGNVAKALLQEPTPDLAGIPGRADLAVLLTRQWTSGPSRVLNRLKTQAQVGIQVGLDEIWTHLNGGGATSTTHTRWLVTNESRRGFRLTYSSGAIIPMRVGELVGLFDPFAPGCHICVVRWMVSDRPDHVDLGLEELAGSARPAIVRPMNNLSTSAPALLLPDAGAAQNEPTLITSVYPMESDCELSIGALDAKLRLQPKRIVERMAKTQLVQFSSVA